ncbi:MAG: TetR family transcriptional regulator [Marinibacterium sp.]|nr:TetR family transcriptional regulator [Marinibacterium sp.]
MTDQPPRTQKDRRSQSDARIIAAAIDLYAAQGYLKTTLNQIGTAAGCTGALISTRYGSKTGLLRAVLANITSRFASDPVYIRQVEAMFTDPRPTSADPHPTAADHAPPDTSLSDSAAEDHASRSGFGGKPARNDSARQLLRAFIRLYLEDVGRTQSRMKALHVIMGEALGAVPEVQDDIIKVNTLFRLRIIKLIEAGMDAGEYPPHIDTQNAAIAVVGLLRGVTMQALFEPDVVRICDQIPRIQDAVAALLKPPAPA